jgi:hypothetical protein
MNFLWEVGHLDKTVKWEPFSNLGKLVYLARDLRIDTESVLLTLIKCRALETSLEKIMEKFLVKTHGIVSLDTRDKGFYVTVGQLEQLIAIMHRV